MSPARYRAELEALAREECTVCEVEYPTEEMAVCPWCENDYCRCHFHEHLNCCHRADCLYQAANRLRELRDAALAMLGAATPQAWQWCLRTAQEILRGEKR